jgi:predicted Rossmann fold nucleotide-binding protein DprA/Smf involved in DNA uptake
MNIKKITSESLKYPSTLKRLSSPPKQLFIQGRIFANTWTNHALQLLEVVQ